MVRVCGAVILSLAAACSACGRPQASEAGSMAYPPPLTEPGGSRVAKIGPVTFSSAELERRIAAQAPLLRDRMKDPAQRAEFIEQEVRIELLAQEGWRRGYYKDPQVQAELKKAIVQKLMREELEKRTRGDYVAEEDLVRSFEKHHDEFNKAERVRLSIIVRPVKNETQRKEERALLERVRREVSDAEKQERPSAFSDAARMHSRDEVSLQSAGDLDFLTRQDVEARFGPETARDLFEVMPVSESSVRDTADAVVLIKKTGFRRGMQRTFDQVKEQVRARVVREKRNAALEELVAELKKSIGVEVDAEAIKKLKVEGSAPPSPAPGAPGATPPAPPPVAPLGTPDPG